MIGLKKNNTMNADEYFTIGQQQHQAEIKIKGSRFIGTALSVTSEEQAAHFIQSMSRQYYNATHNCYAYIVGLEPAVISRFNDDGEPAGTAGQPILNVIQGKNLTDAAVVVTRYFGGTKLGKGGLVHAYSECADAVLAKCTVIKKFIYHRFKLSFNYDLTGAVMHVISLFEATIEDSTYGDFTELALAIRQSLFEEFKQQIIEKTAGNISIF